MTVEILRLREGVTVAPSPTRLTLVEPGRGRAIGPVTAGQHAMMRVLAGDGGTEQQLTREVTAVDGSAGLARAYSLLATLRSGRWLRATLTADGHPVVSVEPWGAPEGRTWQGTASVATTQNRNRGPFVLSRFAVARRSGADGLLLESPRTGVAAVLHDSRSLLLLGRLASPLTWQDAQALDASAPAVLARLIGCGLVVPDGSAEESELSLRQWAPHELWFHVRSTSPTTGQPWGGTAWAQDVFPPLPAQPPTLDTARHPLPVPDLDGIVTADPPLTRALEERRSIREHDDERPMSVSQLAEFLYRTARVRGLRNVGGHDIADRPYPSGGSLHELQAYVVARSVVGLEPGLYRYDGQAHALDRLEPYEGPVATLSERAAAAARMSGSPQVVVVVAARFGRTMWKYQSMAYALVLKNTGVLLASMYLVATAMRLAPCAVAGPDAEAFALATGLDPMVEAGVAGFVLGSARPPSLSRKESEHHS
ncbi:SagB family peptide dehydrogenase [Streptomyces fagopyri]|uniref:SagB family peptide dehydrogenase n=1 Tax=Streptomyces fagopyri TaxID=2662397 RepID=UPI00371E2EE5